MGALRPLAFSGPHNPPEYKAPLGIILSKFPCSGYNGEALSRILAPYLEAPVGHPDRAGRKLLGATIIGQ